MFKEYCIDYYPDALLKVLKLLNSILILLQNYFNLNNPIFFGHLAMYGAFTVKEINK